MVSDLDFSCFGLWLAPGYPLLLALPRSLRAPLASVAICMSSDLRAAVVELSSAVTALTAAVTSLQAAIPVSSSSPVPSPAPIGCVGNDFVIGIVADSYTQSGLAAALAVGSSRGVEEGPPGVPEEVLVAGEAQVGSRLPFVRERATQAFRFGFWAKVAIDCHTNYEDEPLVTANSELKHWVVLRSPLRVPFRVESFPDLQQFVDLDDRQIIVQSLGVRYQLEAFCSGACIPVPPLWRPSKRD